MNKFHRLLFKLMSGIIPSGPDGDLVRGRLYKPYLKKCGSNFKVAEGAFIYSPDRLEVGDNVYVGYCSYLGNGSIVLADEVLIGNHVSITPANHLVKDGSYRFGGSEYSEIRIGKGTWIAAHSCITAGVIVGSGCLVAAGAVITRSFPDNVIVAGVPAKVISNKINEG